jgi:hypothetical protein
MCQTEHARRRGGWNARPSTAAYLDEAREMCESSGGVLLSTEVVESVEVGVAQLTAVRQATSVLQMMNSTQRWMTLHWRMQIRPSAIMPCLRLHAKR